MEKVRIEGVITYNFDVEIEISEVEKERICSEIEDTDYCLQSPYYGDNGKVYENSLVSRIFKALPQHKRDNIVAVAIDELD